MFFPKKGKFALQSLVSGKLLYKQIESGRVTIRRTMKKQGYIYINVFTSISVTRKSLATRMGKGKGNHSFWIAPIKKGQIIYELSGVSNYKAYKALTNAAIKLPIKTKIVELTY